MSNTKWIDEKIYWLTATLGVTEQQFSQNYGSCFTIYSYFGTGETADLKKIIDIISSNLKIVPPIIHYDWSEELDHDDNLRGMLLNGQLTVSITFTNQPHLMAATLIHELMHYYLIHEKNIKLNDNLENEKLTDLAAIVLGFGDVMLNGKIIDIYKGKVSTLGYLSIKELDYAVKKVHSLRQIYGHANLNEYANQIIKGKLGQVTHNKPRREVKLDLGSLKKMFKSTIEKIKDPYFTPKKKCPFCNKRISAEQVKCNHCHRILKEEI